MAVEGVEEKVRLDLPAESAELRLRELFVEARGFGLLTARGALWSRACS